MGQKVTTRVIDKSLQDYTKYALYYLLVTILQKIPSHKSTQFLLKQTQCYNLVAPNKGSHMEQQIDKIDVKREHKELIILFYKIELRALIQRLLYENRTLYKQQMNSISSNNFFRDLTIDQVVSTYKLVLLLRRLRVTGTLKLKTINTVPNLLGSIDTYDFIDMRTNLYGIERMNYDPIKGLSAAEELLEDLFGRKSTSYRGTP